MADGRHVAMVDGRHVGKYWKYHNSPSNQGRRHGFENGGTILRAERAKNFFLTPPTFWPVGGTKYCLDS